MGHHEIKFPYTFIPNIPSWHHHAQDSIILYTHARVVTSIQQRIPTELFPSIKLKFPDHIETVNVQLFPRTFTYSSSTRIVTLPPMETGFNLSSTSHPHVSANARELLVESSLTPCAMSSEHSLQFVYPDTESSRNRARDPTLAPMNCRGGGRLSRLPNLLREIFRERCTFGLANGFFFSFS